MAQSLRGIDRIPIPASVAHLRQNPVLGEFGKNALHRSLGDPDASRDIARRHQRITLQAHKHVGVIGQKGPLWRHNAFILIRKFIYELYIV